MVVAQVQFESVQDYALVLVNDNYQEARPDSSERAFSFYSDLD